MEDSAYKSPSQVRKIRFRAGVLCVLGCTLAMLVLITQLAGLSLLWGTQMLYVASYYHHFDSEASMGTMYLVFPLAGITFSAGSVLTIYLYHQFGGRKVIICSTLSMSVCMVACTYIPDYRLFIVVYSIVIGVGCSGIVFPAMYPSWYYFPKHKGVVTGIIMVAYGAGLALQGLAFTFLMNPNNDLPNVSVATQKQDEMLFDYSIAQNYPFTFRMFAVGFVVVGLVGALLVTEPNMTPVQRRTLSVRGSYAVHSRDSELIPECPDLKTALRTWTFVCLLLISGFGYTFDYYLLVQYKSYAENYITNDHLLTTIGSISQVGNIAGRLLLSVLVDYLDCRLLLVGAPLINAVMAYTLKYAVTSDWMYTLWVTISLFSFALCLAPTAVICGKIYGTKMGGSVFSFVMLGLLFSHLSTIGINSGIQQNYGFDAAFNLMALTSLGVSVLGLTIKPKYEWYEKDSLIPS